MDYGDAMLNLRSKDVLSSLPLLASVLGDKYGVEVRIGGDQAATNGKVIFIPSLPLDADEDLLSLVRGYIDHESGHIRFTDHEAMVAAHMDNVTQFLWNCIEDWRIENKLAELYPGCKQNLQWLLRRLFLKAADAENERAGDENPALSVLRFVLLTVRMWDVPEIGEKQQEEKDRAETYFSGLTSELEQILDRVRLSCTDTQSAIAYAHELAECIRQWSPVQDSSATSGRESMHGNKALPAGQECRQQKAEEGTGAHDNTVLDQAAESLSDLFKLAAKDLPPTSGAIMAEKLESLKESDQHDCIAVAQEQKVSVDPLSDEERQMALRASNALKVRLQGLLQAAVCRPSYLSRRGRLYTQSLYRLQTGNASVFLQNGERLSISTAVHILLDASGSMSGKHIRLASQACYAVAKALEGIQGISVGVSIFPASAESYDIGPLDRHGERVSDRFAVQAHGTTPLAESLWWVLHTLSRQKEARKIILILTDGSPNNLQAGKKALHTGFKCGIESYGIGILDSYIENLLPDSCVVISTLNDLTPAMFRMLQRCLVGGSNGRRD